MASRSDIQAGRAYVELYVKNSQLVKGLNFAKAQLQSLGKNIMAIGSAFAGLGTAIITPLMGAVAEFAKVGSELNDISERTGLASNNLAELGFAAEQTGASLADVEKALKFMAKSGKDVKDFDKLAEKIAGIEDPSKRAQAAIKAFGKGGTALLPMLADLQELREEARRLGVVPTQAAVRMADAIGDAFDSVRASIKAAIFNVGAELAPVLLPVLETVKRVAAWFSRMAQSSGELIRRIFVIGASLAAVGGTVTAIGALIYGLGAAFGIVAGAVVTVAGLIGGLLSPVALLVGALLGGVYAWARFTQSGQAAVQSIISFFTPLFVTVRDTLSGIANAFIAGDLGLAAQIGMTAVRLAFEAAMMPIAKLWYDLKLTVLTVLDKIGVLAFSTFNDLGAALAGPIAFMASLWETFSAYVVGRFVMLAETAAAFWKMLGDGGAVVGGALFAIFNSLETIIQTFFKVVGIGVFELAKKVAALSEAAAKAAPSALNFAVTQSTGLDVGAAIGRAGDAAAQAGEQARSNAADANRQLRTDAAIRREGRVGEGFNDQIARERRVRELQAELDELNKRAAAAREAAGQDQKRPTRPDTSGLDEIKSRIAVGFSGAGLLAQAGGTQDRIARGVETLAERQQRTNELLEQMVDDEVEVEA